MVTRSDAGAAVLCWCGAIDCAGCPDQLDASCSSASDASAIAARRVCAWCGGEIPARARRDALCCSKRCRQARHRFTRAVGRGAVAGGRALRLAYADPPYPGNSRRLYGQHPDFAGEVDHELLIRRLSTYDGWALSTSAAALQSVLSQCPPGVRVAAWHRGERPTRSLGPLNGWEPVIFCGGRPDLSSTTSRRVDALVFFARPRLTDPHRVIGAKPATFARWIFDLLGAAPGDSFDDLYPGSGGIARAWSTFCGVAAAQRDGSDQHREFEPLCSDGDGLTATPAGDPSPPIRLGDPRDASRAAAATCSIG